MTRADGAGRIVSTLLLLALPAGCARNYDHTIAVIDCDGTTIEAIERYRQAAFSGHTVESTYVLRVRSGFLSLNRKEIDITPFDIVDLSAVERALSETERWRPLAPHTKASRRVFVSPEEFSGAEFATIAACLERGVEEINRGFATPRPPVEYFDGDTIFRERWAGLRSVAHKRGVAEGNACQERHTRGYRFACSGTPFFLSLDGYGYFAICAGSDSVLPCGRAVGRLSPDGTYAAVRALNLEAGCAQGELGAWLEPDGTRFVRDCRLSSGQSPADLFEVRGSESLD